MSKTYKYLKELGYDTVWYLDDKGFDKEHLQKFRKNREKYGVDDRETWALNDATIIWIYIHLRRYMDLADGVIDLDYHQFTVDGDTKTEKEWIEWIIDVLEVRLRVSVLEDECKLSSLDNNTLLLDINELVTYAFKVYGEILPALWW